MTPAISDRARIVRFTDPQGKRVRIVPIVGPSHDNPPYALLTPQTHATVRVSEVSEAGSVPSLRIENGLDVRVFLMDGQELRGAKQNRILNTDVMVPAGATITIPVSCVESGRWRRTSATFSPGKHANFAIRSGKSKRVHDNLKSHGHHDADQHAVWADVAQCLDHSDAQSPTMALLAAYEKRDGELREFRRALSLPTDDVGVAAFSDDTLRGIDLFDRHSTLAWFWDSLVDSYALDLLNAPFDVADHKPAGLEHEVIRRTLDEAASADWESFASPGEGVDWRLQRQDLTGSALVMEDRVVVHLQLFGQQLQR